MASAPGAGLAGPAAMDEDAGAAGAYTAPAASMDTGSTTVEYSARMRESGKLSSPASPVSWASVTNWACCSISGALSVSVMPLVPSVMTLLPSVALLLSVTFLV